MLVENGEKLHLAPDLETLAKSEQREALESDEREGLVREYLETLLPEDWDGMDLFDRRSFLAGVNNIGRAGTVARTRVCNMEIWCELFGKDQGSLGRAESNNLTAMLTKLGWVRKEKKERVKPYGPQFVFVPGDTVTLGWERFAVGLNQESREELEYLFREWEMERDPEELIGENMAPVRRAAIAPMLAGRELEELGWEPVQLNDPRLRPDWLEDFRQFALTGRDSLTLAGRARFEREGDSWQACLYHEVDYLDFQKQLQKQGFSLPTAEEWAYLCGGGCRTLFPWGDGLDYSMRLRWFEDTEDEGRPYDMEEPNFFGLSIAYDPYMREVVQADKFTTCGGDGGCNICGGMGPFLGFLPCSPHYKPEVQEDNALNGDYDFYRPIIRVEMDERRHQHGSNQTAQKISHGLL